MPALSTSIPVIAPLKTLALKEDLLFDVSVIIVNYNGKAFLADCLEALKGDTDSLKVESIVVDNGSVDGSIELLQDKLKPTTLILAGENLGFSRGNNVGMAIARGRYFLLLNSDCFIQPGLLKTLVERLEAKEEAAAIGPRLLNSDGSLQRSCHNFFSPMVVVLEQSLLWQWLKFIPGFKARFFLASDHARPAEVDWVSGACLLLKRSALEKIGGLDECFFFYIEEVDLCMRLRQSGWKVLFEPGAQAVHLGGGSGSGPALVLQLFQSIYILYAKHYGWWDKLLLHMFIRGMALFKAGRASLTWLLAHLTKTPGKYKKAASELGVWLAVIRLRI